MTDIDSFPMTILKDGDPKLRLISDPVDIFDDKLKRCVDHMFTMMTKNSGRGLAAIQIGIQQRIVIAVADKQKFVMINPVVTRSLNRFVSGREGCLSVHPKDWRAVSRPAKCEITWQDVNGEFHSGNFSGEPARVLQHEIDHLDGILIVDKPLV